MQQVDLNKLVLLTLSIVAALLLVLDAWIIASHGEDSSISATINRLAKQYPALPFATGMLVAHLFKM